jgi:hypothetical protein
MTFAPFEGPTMSAVNVGVSGIVGIGGGGTNKAARCCVEIIIACVYVSDISGRGVRIEAKEWITG